MNKTVLLIHVLIASSLSKPVDKVNLASDVSVSKVGDDSQVVRPPGHIAVYADEENGLVSKSVDSIISSSEIIKINHIDKQLDDNKHYLKALEENDKQGVETKSIKTSNDEHILSNLEPENKVGTQSLQLEEKKAIGIESVTAVMEDDSTEYLENPTDSSIETKIAPEEESRSTKPESVKSNDESNDSWDVLDDLIVTRRMMSDLENKKGERTSEIISGRVDTKTASPQESRQSHSAQNKQVKVGKENNNVQVIHLPNISNDPTRGPLYQPEGLRSYFVNPAKTNTIQNKGSSTYRIMEYPSTPAKRNFGPIQTPSDYKGHTRIDDYIPVQIPVYHSYSSPLLQSPINKPAYILSKLFDASEQPIRNGRRMNKNSAGLATPKFLNINLPKLASSCGVTRACALFTI